MFTSQFLSHVTSNLANFLSLYFSAKFNSDSELRPNSNSDINLSCLMTRDPSQELEVISIWYSYYIWNRKVQAEAAQAFLIKVLNEIWT